MRKNAILGFSVFLLASCTSTSVKPVDPALKVSKVCVQENPKVAVEDFLPVVLAGLERNGVEGRVLVGSGADISDCHAVLKYTARRTWDMTAYLRTANIQLWDQKGKLIAKADYKVANGFNLSKYAGTATKIDPLIDKLFVY